MKSKQKPIMLSALVICAAMLLNSCAFAIPPYLYFPNNDAPTTAEQLLPEETAFSDAGTESQQGTDFIDMAYVRPDIDKIYDQLDVCEKLRKLQDPEPLLKAYDELLALYESAESRMALADIRYSLDIANEYYSDEYTYLLDELTGLDLFISGLTVSILKSSHKQAAEEKWGAEFVQRAYRSAQLNGESVDDLLIEEQELMFEYDRLCSMTTVQYNGRDWTLDELNADRSLNYETYSDLYSEYCEKLNNTAGPLFLKLAALRSNIAKELEFENYSDYAYACFGRDYTPEDAKKIHAAVKKNAVPLYIELFNTLYDTDTEMLYSLTMDQNEVLADFKKVAPSFSEALDESIDFMLEYGLYDLSMDEEKLSGGFTAYLADYESPFLFDNWDGSYRSVSGLTHELGHFNSYYHLPVSGWNSADNIDLAEVDSQGLELLFTDYYDEIFGSLARAAVNEELQDALYSMITGCMEDEFQQVIYQHPGLPLKKINDLYFKLAKEYGLYEIYGTEGTEWVLIPHTFRSPLYYISYAVSMQSALELWEISVNEPDRAKAVYGSLLNRDPNKGFVQTLEQYGLSDPFTPGLVNSLCKAIKDFALR